MPRQWVRAFVYSLAPLSVAFAGCHGQGWYPEPAPVYRPGAACPQCGQYHGPDGPAAHGPGVPDDSQLVPVPPQGAAGEPYRVPAAESRSPYEDVFVPPQPTSLRVERTSGERVEKGGRLQRKAPESDAQSRAVPPQSGREPNMLDRMGSGVQRIIHPIVRTSRTAPESRPEQRIANRPHSPAPAAATAAAATRPAPAEKVVVVDRSRFGRNTTATYNPVALGSPDFIEIAVDDAADPGAPALASGVDSPAEESPYTQAAIAPRPADPFAKPLFIDGDAEIPEPSRRATKPAAPASSVPPEIVPAAQ